MFIAILTTDFQLHGCTSLKEKRHRISGLKDRFGASKNIAVCESDSLDSKTHAQISFTCVGNDKKGVEATLAKIVDFCTSSIDAQITNDRVEWL